MKIMHKSICFLLLFEDDSPKAAKLSVEYTTNSCIGGVVCMSHDASVAFRRVNRNAFSE